MRKLIRRSIDAFLAQAASGLEGRGLGLIAGELLAPAGGGNGGGGGAGGGSGLGASSASLSPVVRVLAQRLVMHVAGACLQVRAAPEAPGNSQAPSLSVCCCPGKSAASSPDSS